MLVLKIQQLLEVYNCIEQSQPSCNLKIFETYKSMLLFNGYCNFLIIARPRKNVHLPGLARIRHQAIRSKKIIAW